MSDGERMARLFAEAEALPPADREGFLAALREESGVLADEVASLLAASGARGSVLDGSPWQALGEEPPGELQAVPAAIGPYSIERRIGGGGMGSVFLAQQRGDGFERQVAIKVLDRPAAEETRLRRFREEARILAGLEHPGIARFYDAGRAEDGGLYLVLEYVEGCDLLAHVRGAGLDLRQRIELFLQVVDTVAFAHRRMVVHRDLKPGNVLVDADGRARLLDFGISKILDDEGSGEPTRTDFRALTPAYASPEQLRGERAGAASDVYSLGVMLYELLAGERPFVARATPAAFVRAVLEEDPAPPSTAARRSTASHGKADRADGAFATGEATTRVGRDLDAICLKALRREPAERYPSATDLADDLRRYLDGRPVAARRGGRRYRLAKLLRRRRAWLGTAAALLVAIAAVLFAAEARWRAELASRPPEPPTPRPFPFSPSTLPEVEEARRRFDAAPADVAAGAELALALLHESRAEEAAVVGARLRQIPGKADDPLVDYVEGIVASKLDQPQRALIHYDHAVERAVAAGRGELLAQCRAARGRLLTLLGRSAEARADMAAARADFQRAGDLASLGRVSNDLAIEYLQEGDLATGERLMEEALTATRAASPHNRGAVMLRNLAEVHRARGRLDVAEGRAREAIAAAATLSRPGLHGDATVVLAEILHELGRSREAAPLFDAGIELLRVPGHHERLGIALFARACFDLDRGVLDRWREVADEIASTAPASGTTTSLGYAEALRGYAARAVDDLPAARAHFGESHRLLTEVGLPESAAWMTLGLADVEAEAGGGQTIAAIRRLAQLRAELARQHPSALTRRAEARLALLAAAAGRAEDAARHLAAGGAPAEAQSSLPLRLALLRARARAARAAGRLDEARRDLRAAIAAATTSERKVDELRLRLDLAELELRAGERRPARDLALGVREEAIRRGLDGLAVRAAGVAESAATTPSKRL